MREHQHGIARTLAAMAFALSLVPASGVTPAGAADAAYAGSSSARTASPGVPAQALPDGAIVELYDEAFRLLRNGETSAAGDAFAVVVALFSDDPLATNAHYWLGETYALQGRYGDAARHFAAAYERSGQSGGSLAGAALLKLSSAHRQSGDTAGACSALDRLAREQPVEAWRLGAMVAAERRDAGCSAYVQDAVLQRNELKTTMSMGSSTKALAAGRPAPSGASDDRLAGALEKLSYPQGQYLLGLIHEEGKRVERSLEKAREYYRRAAGSGSAPAQNALTRLQAAN